MSASFGCILYIPYSAAYTAKYILFQEKQEATVHVDIGKGINGAEQTKTWRRFQNEADLNTFSVYRFGKSEHRYCLDIEQVFICDQHV